MKLRPPILPRPPQLPSRFQKVCLPMSHRCPNQIDEARLDQADSETRIDFSKPNPSQIQDSNSVGPQDRVQPATDQQGQATKCSILEDPLIAQRNDVDQPRQTNNQQRRHRLHPRVLDESTCQAVPVLTLEGASIYRSKRVDVVTTGEAHLILLGHIQSAVYKVSHVIHGIPKMLEEWRTLQGSTNQTQDQIQM